MSQTVDRRVDRTRKSLRDALVTLVIERGWDEVSVKDVCDAANVGRSTFYSHFADKEELLTSGFKELGAHLRAPPVLGDRADGTILRFTCPLLEHVLGQRPLFRALIGKNSGRVVQRRFHQLVNDLVAEELAHLDLGQLPRETTVRFVAGGVGDVLGSAIENRASKVEAVDAEIQLLVRTLLPVQINT